MSLLIILACLAGISIPNFFPTWHWLQELNSNLGAYYFLAHGSAVFLLLWSIAKGSGSRGVSALFVLHALLLIGYGRRLVPFFMTPLASGYAQNYGLTVLSLNVHSDNRNYTGLRELLENDKPDLVALFESTSKWHEVLIDYGCVEENFAPQIFEYGISFCSRLPAKLRPRFDFGSDVRPGIIATLSLPDGEELRFIAFDALPPLGQRERYLNKILVRRVSGILRHQSQPSIVATDLNATPFSSLYDMLLEGGGVSDARRGFGFSPTWNANQPLQLFMIDHLFVKGGVMTKSFERAELAGSDHYGLLARFAIPR